MGIFGPYAPDFSHLNENGERNTAWMTRLRTDYYSKFTLDRECQLLYRLIKKCEGGRVQRKQICSMGREKLLTKCYAGNTCPDFTYVNRDGKPRDSYSKLTPARECELLYHLVMECESGREKNLRFCSMFNQRLLTECYEGIAPGKSDSGLKNRSKSVKKVISGDGKLVEAKGRGDGKLVEVAGGEGYRT